MQGVPGASGGKSSIGKIYDLADSVENSIDNREENRGNGSDTLFETTGKTEYQKNV